MPVQATYGYGYDGERLTWEQFEKRAGWKGLHPEIRRRAKQMMIDCPYDLPFGNGFRTAKQQEWTNENSAGTVVGNSYHEASDVLGYALAFDWYYSNATKQAVDWANANAARYGFQTGKNWAKSEPWHFQAKEVPASKRDYRKNVHTLSPWPIPNNKPKTYYSPWPTLMLKLNSTGASVKQLQTELTNWNKNPGPIDGRYGSRTSAAVQAGQREVAANGFDPGPFDGIYGSRTRAAFDAYYRARGWGFR